MNILKPNRRFSTLVQQFPLLHQNLPEHLLIYFNSNFFGRGLVTKEDIPFGEIVFQEDPIYRFEPSTFDIKTVNEIEEIIEREIDEDTRAFFLELHLPEKYEQFPFAGRIRASAYPGRLYGVGSMINHNCWPNVVISDQDEFIACRDIKAGEELFTRYGTEVDKSMCTKDRNCKCHFGAPEYQVNQELRVQGSMMDYFITQYSRRFEFETGDAGYLFSPSTQIIWDTCQPIAQKIYKGRSKRTNRPQFWQAIYSTDWVEEWFEETYPKFLPLIQAIHDRKVELSGGKVKPKKRKIHLEVDPHQQVGAPLARGQNDSLHSGWETLSQRPPSRSAPSGKEIL